MTRLIDLTPEIKEAYEDARSKLLRDLCCVEAVSYGSRRAALEMVARAIYEEWDSHDSLEMACEVTSSDMFGICDDWRELYASRMEVLIEESYADLDFRVTIEAIENLARLLRKACRGKPLTA